MTAPFEGDGFKVGRSISGTSYLVTNRDGRKVAIFRHEKDAEEYALWQSKQ